MSDSPVSDPRRAATPRETAPASPERTRAVRQEDLPLAYRPRQKLLARGPGALSQGELLQLVLGNGPRREPVERLADRLLRRFGLAGLADLPAARWLGESGLASGAAVRLCAVFELGRRAYGPNGRERPALERPADVARRLRHLGRVKKEHLVGLYLDAQNRLLHQETLSIGSLNTTRTHPREILFPAIVHLALGFILAHNHPSGTTEPSAEDLEFTRSVRRAGELMGIELYDHLIVAGDRYTSLRERGLV